MYISNTITEIFKLFSNRNNSGRYINIICLFIICPIFRAKWFFRTQCVSKMISRDTKQCFGKKVLPKCQIVLNSDLEFDFKIELFEYCVCLDV